MVYKQTYFILWFTNIFGSYQILGFRIKILVDGWTETPSGARANAILISRQFGPFFIWSDFPSFFLAYLQQKKNPKNWILFEFAEKRSCEICKA